MRKPTGWDDVEAATGEFKKLTAGGHPCIILKADITKARSGAEMLALVFDIDEGDEFAGYFASQYTRFLDKDGDNAKWPNAGVYRQLTEGKSMGYFKGMLMNIEASNPGYKWDWNEKSLVGKKFGGVFQEERYLSTRDGSEKTRVNCIAVRPVNGIENVTVPKVKDNTHRDQQNGFGASVGDEIPF